MDRHPNYIREISFNEQGQPEVIGSTVIDPNYVEPLTTEEDFDDHCDNTAADSIPDMSETVSRRFFSKNIAIAGITGAVLASGAGALVVLDRRRIQEEKDSIRPLTEEEKESKTLIYTYMVKENENLSTITTDIYTDKSGDDEWVDNFIDNNIANTTEDGRYRDRDTIYEGDILEITLDPELEVPGSVICPLEKDSDEVILKDSPDCVEDPS